jgi:hypothetical protein
MQPVVDAHVLQRSSDDKIQRRQDAICRRSLEAETSSAVGAD